ncbi:hypothetical protein FA10DRAFT_299744 [Acaromyces ingoldii]|uniref:HNH nuclease domain-containing protein n=1 Tax=Acaromyces ingoldii TaxID=215250 RepID=A0A316YPM8_9BASI|nr:hypothetical protein FA10DRAFT_299744 [Acaromyces ingoldii]PWN91102.1 hypothetical protein FA10DRAFT_299744 [Acaromyces ingoldii]
MAAERRNIHVFSKGEEVGGIWQHGNVSKRRFREWLDYCWHFEREGKPVAWSLAERCEPGSVQERSVVGPTLDRTTADEAMPTGTFDVLTDGTWEPVDHSKTPHRYHPRTISLNSSSSSRRNATFADRIRKRDQRCLITGFESNPGGRSRALQAAHIFARAHLDRWRACGFDRLVEDTDRHIGNAKIDSVQNGLLLRADVHNRFVDHEIAVDVDNGYAIYDFSRAGWQHGERLGLDHLEPGSSERPLDALFRDHFWQAVLANVRGAAKVYDDEPQDDWANPDTLCLDNDALHKTDKGRLRLELELGSRLNHLIS